jgi:ankyrin repeat protein
VFGGATDCLAYLLDNGGDVLIDEPNLEGCTCLHLTAMHNRLDCARLLLETCADATLLNNQGQNA